MNFKTIWELLNSVQRFSIEALSFKNNKLIWSGYGEGEINVLQNNQSIIFEEKGKWQKIFNDKINIPFKNIYRWSAEKKSDVIKLEHLRFGKERPVYLFDLIFKSGLLKSKMPFICGRDKYSAKVEVINDSIKLSFTIKSADKKEEIFYTYY